MYASAIEIVLWQLVPLVTGQAHDGTMDPWTLSGGWDQITLETMKLPRVSIVPEWVDALRASPWLRALPQEALESAREVPANFPGNVLQPSGSTGRNWLFFAGRHVS